MERLICYPERKRQKADIQRGWREKANGIERNDISQKEREETF